MCAAKKKTGLGRGLKALISQQQSGIATPFHAPTKFQPQTTFKIPIDSIIAAPHQARKDFDIEALRTLTESIKSVGMLQPIVVRKHPQHHNKYELVAGERRLRAAKNADLDAVPAVILEADNQHAIVMGLIENLQREDLNPIEESEAYLTLAETYGLKQEEISKAVGRSRSHVANVMRFAKLPVKIRTMISSGELSAGHAKALLALEDGGEQISAAGDIVLKSLSVRQAEELVRRMIKAKKTMRSSKKTESLYPDVREMLTQRLSTKINITGKQDRGAITIYYYSKEDLIRIVELLKE